MPRRSILYSVHHKNCEICCSRPLALEWKYIATLVSAECSGSQLADSEGGAPATGAPPQFSCPAKKKKNINARTLLNLAPCIVPPPPFINFWKWHNSVTGKGVKFVWQVGGVGSIPAKTKFVEIISRPSTLETVYLSWLA